MGKKTKEPEKKIIRPGRDIIAEKADALNKKLFKALEQGVCELTLDFKNVKSVDPVGLSVIAAAHNTVCNAGTKMVLKNVPHEIDKLFDTLGLNEHFAKKTQENG
jgi:anti-sigma B factor antagonist